MVQSNEVTVADVVRLDGLDAPFVILDVELDTGIAHVLPVDVSQVCTVRVDRIVPYGHEPGQSGHADAA
jgi:hypothetical protein